MADLFSSTKVDTSKLELSEFKRPEPKQVVKKEKRVNKVSSGSTHMFGSEERRKEMFPNAPISLKELRKRNVHVGGKKIASFNWDTKELTFHGNGI